MTARALVMIAAGATFLAGCFSPMDRAATDAIHCAATAVNLDDPEDDGGHHYNLSEAPTRTFHATGDCSRYVWVFTAVEGVVEEFEGENFTVEAPAVGFFWVSLYAAEGGDRILKSAHRLSVLMRSESATPAGYEDFVLEVPINCCPSDIYWHAVATMSGPVPILDGDYVTVYDADGTVVAAGERTVDVSREALQASWSTDFAYGIWRFDVDRSSPGSPFFGSGLDLYLNVLPDPEFAPPDPSLQE
jgi:hypothetical protein